MFNKSLSLKCSWYFLELLYFPLLGPVFTNCDVLQEHFNDDVLSFGIRKGCMNLTPQTSSGFCCLFVCCCYCIHQHKGRNNTEKNSINAPWGQCDLSDGYFPITTGRFYTQNANFDLLSPQFLILGNIWRVCWRTITHLLIKLSCLT